VLHAIDHLRNVLWIVDLNRQSRDRVVPGIRAAELEQQFAALGRQVLELMYGRRFARGVRAGGGGFLRRRIDEDAERAVPGALRLTNPNRMVYTRNL
jgi:pyruvate dehydrogenase E1 component